MQGWLCKAWLIRFSFPITVLRSSWCHQLLDCHSEYVEKKQRPILAFLLPNPLKNRNSEHQPRPRRPPLCHSAWRKRKYIGAGPNPHRWSGALAGLASTTPTCEAPCPTSKHTSKRQSTLNLSNETDAASWLLVTFINDLAAARARDAPPVLRRSMFLAWQRRWSRTIANSCGRAFACSFVSQQEDFFGADGAIPDGPTCLVRPE